MLSRLRSVVRALVGRRHFEDGLADEVRQHIELYTDDLVRQGMPREEASRRARLEFGSIDNVTLDCREAKGLGAFDALQQHLRYAARLLRKSPAFTATTLATLALCLGANLAIFAVVDAILLRPLPFPMADRSGQHLQHVPEGRRARRWQLRDELLRASGPHRSVCEPRSVPRRRGHRRRDGRDRARVRHARHAGVLHDAWRRAGAWSSVHRRGDHVSDVGRGHRDRHVLARASRGGPAGDRTCAAGGRRTIYGGRRAAAGVQLPLLEAEPVPAARNGPAGARPRATPLRQLVAHDRAASARRLARGGAVADRRPQRGDGADRPAGAVHRRRRLPIDRRAAARGRGRRGPAHAADPAGGRVPPAARGRRQRDQPAADPRQRPHEGAGRAAGDRREPPARRGRGPDRDDAC